MKMSWRFLFKDCFSVFIVKERERRMIKFWIIVCFLVLGVCAQDSVTNHNGAQHEALCDLLKIAAHKWEKARETLSPPLKKALARTLFGKEDGELGELKDLPGDYSTAGGLRDLWCGQPRHEQRYYDNEHQVRWSGHSAPHDMVCLCTAGKDGWPINGTGKTERLCGKSSSDLKAEEGDKGWDSDTQEKEEHGKTQIKATWENVTSDCLLGVVKGERLREALKDFTDKLVLKPIEGQESRKQLGEGNPGVSHACTGSKTYGVCVMYYPKLTPKTWWVELENAIQEDEKIQEQKKREEEEKLREQEDAEKQDARKTETLKSTLTTTNQTDQQHRNDNFTEKLRKFNLTGSSSIILPPSWLLSFAILI
ncbi:Variant surface glycoprotein [Trypanosoma congolense IL3000]|uniref:Variant surface glycoprotein n=1 Tax=Trypanosoma congolense (strain IL3000) TaxID=1068625 RepID=F9WIZ7_TRYCI|nr:Variant surface glycoprotein [Trypanosoma congolense IL3000]